MSTLVSLVRLLLPRRCVACRAPGEWMCDGCGPRLRALAAPLCARCGAPTALAVPACRACSRLRWFTTARSALWLEGPAARARRALEARRDLARAPGRRARGARAAAAARRGDRRRARGARPAAAARRRPAGGAGGRARALVGAAGRAARAPHARRAPAARARRGARRRNVRGAFAARAGPRALALVDDVYTTGATVDECARALRRAGAEQVHVITLARTPLDRTFARAPPGGRLQRTDVPERGGTRCSFR